MKKANKRPARAQKEAKGSAPTQARCTCGHTAPSRYALKEHKEVCRHG
jgi:hypothetical protein